MIVHVAYYSKHVKVSANLIFKVLEFLNFFYSIFRWKHVQNAEESKM